MVGDDRRNLAHGLNHAPGSLPFQYVWGSPRQSCTVQLFLPKLECVRPPWFKNNTLTPPRPGAVAGRGSVPSKPDWGLHRGQLTGTLCAARVRSELRFECCGRRTLRRYSRCLRAAFGAGAVACSKEEGRGDVGTELGGRPSACVAPELWPFSYP
jgi:hypothetical protein